MPASALETRSDMFKRRWICFGKLMSDTRFSLAYGDKITYTDQRGSFQFGFEAVFLFPPPLRTSGERRGLTQSEMNEITERDVQGIESEGLAVQIFREHKIATAKV